VGEHHSLILYSILLGPGALGLASSWRNPGRYGWIGVAGGVILATLSPISRPAPDLHSDVPRLLLLAAAWFVGSFYAGFLVGLLLRRVARPHPSDGQHHRDRRTFAGLAVAGLLAAVSLVWIGFQVLPNVLARHDAWSALESAIPADAKVLHEEVHACGNGADDPIGPPYCGTARLLVSATGPEQCQAEIVDQLTTHGYHVLSTSLAPVDAFNGKDEIRVHVDPRCIAEIDYQRTALVLLPRVIAERHARSALHEAIPPDATVVQEDVQGCAPGDFDPPYCARAAVLLPGESAAEQCRQEIVRQLTMNGYEPRSVGDSSMDFVKGRDEIRISIAPACGAVEVNYRPRSRNR